MLLSRNYLDPVSESAKRSMRIVRVGFVWQVCEQAESRNSA